MLFPDSGKMDMDNKEKPVASSDCLFTGKKYRKKILRILFLYGLAVLQQDRFFFQPAAPAIISV